MCPGPVLGILWRTRDGGGIVLVIKRNSLVRNMRHIHSRIEFYGILEKEEYFLWRRGVGRLLERSGVGTSP